MMEHFGELRSLRTFPGSEIDFWNRFLSGVSLLFQSSRVLRLCQGNDHNWVIVQELDSQLLKTEIEENIHPELLQVAERAHKNGYAFERIRTPIPPFKQPTVVAFLVDEGRDRNHSLVLVFLERLTSSQVSDLVVRSQLIADIPLSYFSSLQTGQSDQSDIFLEILDLTSALIDQKKFLLACMKLVNEIASRFKCSRVSIGWLKDNYVKPIAISHLEKFDAHMDTVSRLEGVFEESLDQDEEIIIPGEVSRGTIVAAHSKYLKLQGLNQLVSFPLRIAEEPKAVVCLEKIEGFFRERELLTLRLVLNHIAILLDNLHKSDRLLVFKALDWFKDRLAWWLGVERISLKLLIISTCLMGIYALVGQWKFNVEAASQLVTDQVAVISAPFDGVIFKVNARKGVSVKKGEVLAEFDTQDLFLREAEILAEVTRFTRESQKARVQGQLADMSISDAKREQAQAQLERIRYFLTRASIRAPIDGVLVEGDHEELQGAPISKGEIFFKVAQIADIYLELKVSEVDIDFIQEGSSGSVALLSNPSEKYAFVVERIIPIAQVDQTLGNFFMVKARFNTSPREWWRPGMSGLGSIQAGERSIYWILTRKIFNYFRLKFWI